MRGSHEEYTFRTVFLGREKELSWSDPARQDVGEVPLFHSPFSDTAGAPWLSKPHRIQRTKKPVDGVHTEQMPGAANHLEKGERGSWRENKDLWHLYIAFLKTATTTKNRQMMPKTKQNSTFDGFPWMQGKRAPKLGLSLRGFLASFGNVFKGKLVMLDSNFYWSGVYSSSRGTALCRTGLPHK